MKNINTKELSRSLTGNIKAANKIDDEKLEDYIIAKHLDVEKEFSIAVKEHKSGVLISARNLLYKKSL